LHQPAEHDDGQREGKKSGCGFHEKSDSYKNYSEKGKTKTKPEEK
jgi:hypothetical protein